MKQSELSRKVLLKNPESVTRQWLTLNKHIDDPSRVIAQSKSLAAIKDSCSQLEEQKKKLSGNIGRAKRVQEPVDALVVEMRSVAQLLKSKNVALNAAADLLIDTLTSNELANLSSTVAKAPGHFLTPQWLQHIKSTYQNHSEKQHASGCSSTSEDTRLPDDVASRQNLRLMEDISDELWDKYVDTCSTATHYHQRAWQTILHRNFPQKIWVSAVLDGSDRVQGMLCLVEMKSPISGHYLLSMPWLIYGGTLASEPKVWDLLAEYAKKKMLALNCIHIELREINHRDGWQPMSGKVAMIKALPKTVEELNAGLGATLRSQIRRSAEYKPTVEWGGPELVSDFYSVFCEKMRDLGTPVYHRGFFDDITNAFVTSTTVCVVRLGGKPVAAALLVKYRDTIEIPWAAARKKYNTQGVNMFMYHQILEYAVKEGFDFFDFGRSTIDTGTYRFKKQWGAIGYPLNWHRFPAADEDVSNEGKSKKLELAMIVWKRLPVWLTKLIGPPVARHLPW